MLKRLSVENYALIDKLELELSDSLNIITGETGAGKSILLGALGLLLGNRSDSTTVKDNGRNCIVEGIFEIGDYHLLPFFEENDLEYDTTTIIRRVITPAGKSRAYINDLPVQLNTLKEFGAHLIDIHSQHQSLLIAQESFRTNILDSIAAHPSLLNEYAESYRSYRAAERTLARLREEAEQNRRDEEWIRFQAEQLQQAQLKEGEQEELEIRQNELAHAEEIKEALSTALQQLDEEETGILPRLKSAEQALGHIANMYPQAEEFASRLRTVLVELRDVEREVAAVTDRIDADPIQLQTIDDRLNTLYTLQQKHKVQNITELLALQHDYERRLAIITESDDALIEAEQAIETERNKALALAKKLTIERRKAADKLIEYVEGTLSELGMPGSRFIVTIDPLPELSTTGHDAIRFLFSSNKNLAPAPVEKIASGGEISRIMLAIKSLVAKSRRLPTLIFDEIDTGVSGRIADAMGNIIQELSENMQVVNITHLPQVASKGKTHFVVYKEQSSDTTRTQIRQLTADERIQEIAKMLSGSTVTDAALMQARLLLDLNAPH